LASAPVAGRLIPAGLTARRTVWRVVTRAQLRGRLAGIAPVGGGLALVGLAAYVVLALAGHTLNPRDYAAAASMFLLTAIVGPGVFAAVEQQTNHEVSARLAAGVDPAPSVRAAAVVAAGLALLMSLVVLALAPVLVPRAFAGHTALLAATVLAVLGAAAAYLLRGIFAGQRRFHWYGISLAGEGLGRLLPCVALVWFGWATADHLRTDLIDQALENAVASRRPPAGVIFHSDRGCQYTSGQYRRLADQHDIRLSVGRRGQCWDNAVAESFFATIKTELLDRKPWPTKTKAHKAIFAYIEGWYNTRRRHSSLGYLSPATFETTSPHQLTAARAA